MRAPPGGETGRRGEDHTADEPCRETVRTAGGWTRPGPGEGGSEEEVVEELVRRGFERRRAAVDRVEKRLQVGEVARQRARDGAAARQGVLGEDLVQRLGRAVVEVR